MLSRRALITTSAMALVAGGGWWLTRPGTDAAGSTLLPGAAMAQDASTTEDAGTETGNPTEGVTEMVMGDPEAPVEVIEYASYTCPHCASFHANQFKALKENYIDTGKVRFVYREVYFDRPGLWASMMARCGGPERFFQITDLIYERQGEWARSRDPNAIVDQLMTIGKIAGLSEDTLNACMRDADTAAALVAWYEENRAADDINSTPSFVIDGVKYSNMSYTDMAAILDQKIEAADG